MKLWILGKLNTIDVSKGEFLSTRDWDLIGIFSSRDKVLEETKRLSTKYPDCIFFIAGSIDLDKSLPVKEEVRLEHEEYINFLSAIEVILNKYK